MRSLELHVANKDAGAAAGISGSALAQATLRGGCEQLQPFSGPHDEHLSEEWSWLVD